MYDGPRRAATNRDILRPPSERSDTIAPPPDPYSMLTPTELADLAEAATRRGYGEHARDLRARTNAEVKAQGWKVERDTLRAELTQTDAKLHRSRALLYTALAGLLTAVTAFVADRVSTRDVDGKAERAAEVVVEERAAPIEQRATAAAETAEAASKRQAELEALEAKRVAQIDRLLQALEAERAKPKGRAK